jgi:hypothetical protein
MVDQDEFMRRARAAQTPERAAGYARCAEAMQRAAGDWLRAHPFAEPEFRTREFEAEVTRQAGRKPGERPAIAAALIDVIDRWAANEDAKSLLRAMDAAGDPHGGATYMQAKIILEEAQKRALGSAPLPTGTWYCTGCERLSDGITTAREADGSIATPPPGSIGVCTYCGAFNRIDAAGTGYEPVSLAEVNRMPKSRRMRLLAARNGVLAHLAREKGRE